MGGCLFYRSPGAPPTDRDGNALPPNPDGTPQVHAQPPFLLRYSPRYFAREEVAPAWFVHDPDTNRLSLRPGVHPPWLRPNAPPGEHSVWLYCEDDPDPPPDPNPQTQILQTPTLHAVVQGLPISVLPRGAAAQGTHPVPRQGISAVDSANSPFQEAGSATTSCTESCSYCSPPTPTCARSH